MAKLSSRDLDRIEREFARLGLLLGHDPVLPSFTTLAIRQPIRGSWWSHPRTHEIYDLLQSFHRGAGVLSVKLINGKLTYVHRRLWPALLNATRGRGAWQREGLSPAAEAVLDDVRRRGAVRADHLSGPSPAERGPAIRELEGRLLIQASSVHTETGAHRKLLRSWSRWCADSRYSYPHFPPAEGRRRIEAAAHGLAGAGARPLRLPWSR